MFKNLRKKITEEVGQPSMRLPVQQLSQLISGDSPRAEHEADLSAFSLDDDGASQTGAPPAAGSRVAGRPPSVPARLRHGSAASSTVSESPLPAGPRRSTLHAELESGSEVSSLAGLGAVSKEQLLHSYQRMRAKYNKYRGRYTDLARAFHSLENDNEKMRSSMAEAEERSQRRVSELREQCTLEQQAKAHLEEALRTDLEERDELVKLLTMKVQLLKEGRAEDATVSTVRNGSGPPTSEAAGEVLQLREKVRQQEELLGKCRDNIQQNVTRTSSLTAENERLQQRLTSSQETHRGELERLEAVIADLRQAMSSAQQQQQESAMTTAEQKATMHQELELKEAQVHQLQEDAETKRKTLEQLKSRVATLETETSQLRETHRNQLAEVERLSEEEKAGLVQELSRAKQEALRVLEQELETRLAEQWGRRLQLREEELRAEIREKDDQLQLAAETEQLQREAAAAGGRQSQPQDDQLTATIDGLRAEQVALEARLRQAEEARSVAEVGLQETKKEAEARLEEARVAAEAILQETKKEAEAKLEKAVNEARKKAETRTEEAVKEALREAEAKADEATKEAAAAHRKASEGEAALSAVRATEAQLEDARKTAETRLEDVRKEAETRLEEAKKEAEKEAETRLEEAKKEAETRLEEAKKEAETRLEEAVAEARRQADAELEEARREAGVRLEEVQQAADARLEALRAEVRQESDAQLLEVREEVQRERETQLEEARAEAEKAAEAQLQQARAEAEKATEARLEEARQQAAAQLEKELETVRQTVSAEYSARLESRSEAEAGSLADLTAKHDAAASELRAQLAAERSRAAEGGHERQQLQQRMEKLSGVVCTLEESLRELSDKYEAETRTAAALTAERDQLAGVTGEMAALRAAKRGLEEKVSALSADTDGRLAAADAERRRAEQTLAQKDEELTQLRRRVETAEAAAEQVRDERDAQKTDLDEALRTARSELESTRQACEEKATEVSRLESVGAELDSQVSRAEETNRQLAAELAALQQSADQLQTSVSLEEGRRLAARSVTEDCELRLREQEQAHQRQVQMLIGKAEDHEGHLTQQHRERVRSLYKEIDEKVEAIDLTRTQLKDREDQLHALRDDYQQQLEQLRSQFSSQLEETVERTANESRQELDRLQRDLQNERRRLDEASRVAAAAVETGTTSLETIRKQVLAQHKQIELMRKKHKREVTELRRLLELRHVSLPDPAAADGADRPAGLDPHTELEYLRNILFEYMMGKEPLTLAKVIAAVLKFSSDQTAKVLEREEHRQSAPWRSSPRRPPAP